VAQELIATAKQAPYYWASEATAKVDFLIEEDHSIYPLEVKSGSNQKKKSLMIYQQKYQPGKIVRASAMHLKHDGDLYNFPLYLACKLKDSCR
jgi:predicted AAA+ superfamily ATPase